MSQTMKYGQNKFFKCLANGPVMNELIQRFANPNSKNSFLTDLQNERINNNIYTNLTLETTFEPDFVNGNHSVYVNYINNGQQIFHTSLHLCPKYVNKIQTPLHGKNNITRKTYPFEICDNPNNTGISFCIKQLINTNRDPTLKKEFISVQSVLNKYFDSNNQQMSLYNPRFKQRKNLTQIMGNYQQYTTPLLGGRYKTRKVYSRRRITKRIQK